MEDVVGGTAMSRTIPRKGNDSVVILLLQHGECRSPPNKPVPPHCLGFNHGYLILYCYKIAIIIV